MNRNNKVILKNTIFLYIRTIILTFVSLFSVRLILKALGANDYGTYNVVFGFVTMFTFITGVMINASQRHFSVSLADDDWTSLNRVFSVNIIIYLFFTLALIVLAETVGLWFVIEKLNYPREQISEVIWVYEFSIVTVIITIFSSPFVALLMANEHMIVYAIVSVVEAGLKIFIAIIIIKFNSNRMFFYALLIMLSAIIVNLFYILYGKFKYKRLRIYIEKNKSAYKEVFSFLNWNLIGSSASAFKGQGINVIMNIYFGSTVNAARSIAYQVNNAVSSFSQNFMKAIDPRIIKSYAKKDLQGFDNYIFSASKLSFYLLMVFCLPFIANMGYVLGLWLEDVPQYTYLFMVLVLIEAMVLSMTDPLLTGVQATGKVKWYQIIIGGLALLNMPVSYLLIRISENPYNPFYVAIGIAVLMVTARIIIFKRTIPSFETKRYVFTVILPMLIVSGLVFSLDYFILGNANNFLSLALNCFISFVISIILIYLVALTKNEKKTINKLFKFRKKNNDERR